MDGATRRYVDMARQALSQSLRVNVAEIQLAGEVVRDFIKPAGKKTGMGVSIPQYRYGITLEHRGNRYYYSGENQQVTFIGQGR